MATEMVLGPSLDNVIEPMPGTTPTVAPVTGRRGIQFHPTKPTQPGGIVNIQHLPAVSPSDVLPTNVHVFFTQPVSSVPAADVRTPDWFFKNSGSKSASRRSIEADADGNLAITVPNVAPSLQPYHVQTVLEFQK
jgi:hypothetical protein